MAVKWIQFPTEAMSGRTRKLPPPQRGKAGPLSAPETIFWDTMPSGGMFSGGSPSRNAFCESGTDGRWTVGVPGWSFLSAFQIFFTPDGRKTTFCGLLIEKRLIGRRKEHASKS
jgi:hypothetical protein